MALSIPDESSLDEDLSETSEPELSRTGPRRRPSTLDFLRATATANRAALELAMGLGDPVSITLRGDVERGVAVRVFEGVVLAVETLRDGRERVRVRIAENVEQLVLVDRVMRVSRAGH